MHDNHVVAERAKRRAGDRADGNRTFALVRQHVLLLNRRNRVEMRRRHHHKARLRPAVLVATFHQ